MKYVEMQNLEMTHFSLEQLWWRISFYQTVQRGPFVLETIFFFIHIKTIRWQSKLDCAIKFTL